MTIRFQPEKPENYRFKEPMSFFKRVDLTKNQPKQTIAIPVERGRDFLFRRLVARWSGISTEYINRQGSPDRPAPVPLPVAEPVESGYVDREHIVYMNLSLLTNGHTGTQLDPFSMQDYQDFLVANQAGDQFDYTVYVYGTGEWFEQDPFYFSYGNPSYDLVPYSPAVNGPWRFTSDQEPATHSKTLVCGGIIKMANQQGDLQEFVQADCTFQNMVLICTNAIIVPNLPSAVPTYRYGGNWIYATGNVLFNGGELYDSIVKCDTLEGGTTATNCSFDFNTDNSINTYNGCKLNSTFPAPAIDSPQSFFSWTNYIWELAFSEMDTADIAGYRNGLWGFPRKSAGGLEFYGDGGFYIDIADNTFGHAGTAADPFSFEDWQFIFSDLGYFPSSVWFVKGKRNYQSAYPVLFNINEIFQEYRYWYRGVDGADTAPWVLMCATGITHDGLCKVQGGIIIAYNESTLAYVDLIDVSRTSGGMSFLNCTLYCKDLLFPDYDPAPQFMYNTVVCTGIFEAVRTYAWFNCLAIGEYREVGAAGLIGMVNCAFDADLSGATANTVFTNCFTTWDSSEIIDGLLVFAADADAFDINTIKTNIPDVVFTGNDPDYVLYPVGLYGFERYGIGSAYFPYVEGQMEISTITLGLRKSTSYFDYFHDMFPHLFCSPETSKDSDLVNAPAPVDNDIFSVNFKNSLRRCEKTFNWLVEDSAVIIIDVNKEPPNGIYPRYLDLLVEGYFYDSKHLKRK